MAAEQAEQKTDNTKKSGAVKSVTMKRTVTVKAIVTEQFKQYMDFEIQAALQSTNQRIGQIDEQLKRTDIPPVVREKLTLERDQANQSVVDLTMRNESVKKLEMGSEFVQGMIDGFVTLNVGDNLYEKLGGMEIVVKDGLVESINPTGAIPDFDTQTQ